MKFANAKEKENKINPNAQIKSTMRPIQIRWITGSSQRVSPIDYANN